MTLGDALEEYADTSGSSGLRYDPGAGQFIFTWQTNKTWVNQCVRLVVTLSDDTVHYAHFKFTK